MTDVTVLIPYTPAHDALVTRAIASVEAQTVDTDFIALEDTDLRGAGWTRNRLLTSVTTDYILFLDADDWLEPHAVETMREAIQPGKYVYSDWYIKGQRQAAPQRVWCKPGTWHCITSLCYTDDVLRIGGFDETLPALEDTDFWLKMLLDGVCGVRVAQALFHYSGAGQRSQTARLNGQEQQIKDVLRQRYGGKPVGCCGQAPAFDSTPQGVKQDGDVIAIAMWRGNHPKRGLATGRRYPRMSYPKPAWVAPADIKAQPFDPAGRPMHWQIVTRENVDKVAPNHFVGVEGFAEALVEAKIITPPPAPPESPALPEDYKLLNEPVMQEPFTPALYPIAPDYAKLVTLGAALYAD